MRTDPERASSAAGDARRGAETHRLIKGRRWRVSDPALDETVRQHLVDELMHARRAVKTALGDADSEAESAARARVNDAKVALGERGPKWWEPMSAVEVDARTSAFLRSIGDRLGDIDTHGAAEHLRLPPVD